MSFNENIIRFIRENILFEIEVYMKAKIDLFNGFYILFENDGRQEENGRYEYGFTMYNDELDVQSMFNYNDLYEALHSIDGALYPNQLKNDKYLEIDIDKALTYLQKEFIVHLIYVILYEEAFFSVLLKRMEYSDALNNNPEYKDMKRFFLMIATEVENLNIFYTNKYYEFVKEKGLLP